MISVETEKIYIAITKPVYLIFVELTHLRIKSNTINTIILNLDFGQLMLLRLIFQFNFIRHQLRSKSTFLSVIL
jgi:hypothetical protein